MVTLVPLFCNRSMLQTSLSSLKLMLLFPGTFYKIVIKCAAPILKSSTLNKNSLGMWSYAAVKSMYTTIN